MLDRAPTTPKPILRDSFVTAFVVSAIFHTERVRKLLGSAQCEKFEYIHPVIEMMFFAEKVSHHPPISVSRTEGPVWVAGKVVNVHKHPFNGSYV